MRKGDNSVKTPSTPSNSKRSRENTRADSSIESTPSPQPQTTKRPKVYSATTKKSEETLENTDPMGDADLKAFIEKVVKDSEVRITTQIEKLETLRDEVHKLTTRLDKVQNEERKRNVIIKGLPEKPGEKWFDRDKDIGELAKKLGLNQIDYDYCFRMGPYNKDAPRPRPLLLKMIRQRDALQIMATRRKLAGSNIFIDEDLTSEERKIQFQLRQYANKMKTSKPDLVFRVSKNSLRTTSNGETKWLTLNSSNQVVEKAEAMT